MTEKWDKREEELKNIQIMIKFIQGANESFRAALDEFLGKKYLSDEEKDKLK
jgi:hypothetical protein